ncbi:CRISPR-associated endoribonuclease Cas2 [Philodulcilactobacillus myokoensis]|uniref:CRISPR-associated endoribonuclease Cas2 n=1 Tax=Philodulcilactobacillus myokoensis TaxID=2929573 RepID=A0A9W6ETT4_9LACO|nr:CRISPR-associated endonuclease Cas2 [Philodulcilactobacillus myokoensis]GLB47438.1 CRISPR-associated endoribonuclease Cas2 [Philodulcilactobacillus myokoensis]
MRLMIMFDLPTETSEDKRNYRHFRKSLINEGFVMIQYSVYAKVCVNRLSAKFIDNRVSAFAPQKGVIQSMMMTEKQYNDMHFITGKPVEDIRNTSDRTIIL